MRTFSYFAIFLAAALMCSSSQAQEKIIDEPALCAAIVACDDNGLVAAPYNQDIRCAPRYQEICDQQLAKNSEHQILLAENSALRERVEDLEASLKKARRALAKARR